MFDLSAQQQYILEWLINQVRYAEQHDRQSLEAGFWWMPHWTPKTNDQAEDHALENVWRASLCRSLARLEKRGLITRIKGRRKARTVRVMLTVEGRKVAESIVGY
jgi:hypothetical protein